MALSTPPTSSQATSSAARGWLIVLAVGLTVWVSVLRGPSLGVPVWNVDETIHATVADVLLNGGTLYEDAIDQRAPLTYYATAAIFAVTGQSLFALRLFMMGLIIASAWFLGRTVWRINGAWAGLAAAAVFAAFSNYLLSPGDTYAAHTEWYVVFFTAAALWCFFGGKAAVPSVRRCVVTGVMLGLAVMSKQSALLDLAPAGLALLVIGADRLISWRGVLLRIGGLIAGAGLAIFALIAPSILSGAGSDLLYYTWTYNVTVYGAEFTFFEKLLSGVRLFELLGATYPLFLATGAIGLLAILIRVVQLNPTPATRLTRFTEVYLVAWTITSLGGAMAGGRGFDHYFFPTFAPLAWLCIWAPMQLWRLGNYKSRSSIWMKGVAGIVVLATAYTFTIPPLAARKAPPPPPDPSLRISAWMKSQSTREDRIFVWGFNPDIYHYTARLPASRFLYCTFQTGLIPWTNTDPFVNTEYAIVPGALETLLADLQEHPPRFFVDSSAGPHRFFGKYPVRKFPALHLWLRDHYAEVDPARFSGQGFRIYVRSDLAIEPPPSEMLTDLTGLTGLDGHDRIADGLNHIRVDFHGGGDSQLTGLGLIRDGEVIAAATFLPTEPINLRVPVLVAESTETVSFQPIFKVGDGPWQSGEIRTGQVASSPITAKQRIDFAIPQLSNRVEATGLRAFFGARVDNIDGQRTYALHAPAILTYQLNETTDFLSGKFGLPQGAWSTDNPAPTDGAEFIVRHVPQAGEPRDLFRRYINPRDHGADQGTHNFRVEVSTVRAGDSIELEITPGPSGVASSDWTYWADLSFETSL